MAQERDRSRDLGQEAKNLGQEVKRKLGSFYERARERITQRGRRDEGLGRLGRGRQFEWQPGGSDWARGGYRGGYDQSGLDRDMGRYGQPSRGFGGEPPGYGGRWGAERGGYAQDRSLGGRGGYGYGYDVSRGYDIERGGYGGYGMERGGYGGYGMERGYGGMERGGYGGYGPERGGMGEYDRGMERGGYGGGFQGRDQDRGFGEQGGYGKRS